MKKRVALLLIIALTFVLTACGRETPETALNNAMQAVINYDLETMQKYFSDDITDEIDYSFAEDDSEEAESTKQLYTLIVKNLTYSITNITEEGDTATATIEATNADFNIILGSVFSKAFTELIGYAFLPEEQQLSEEQKTAMYTQWLIEAYSADNLQTVTKTATVNMTYQDNGWKIEATDEFLDAIFGGMMSAGETTNSNF